MGFTVALHNKGPTAGLNGEPHRRSGNLLDRPDRHKERVRRLRIGGACSPAKTWSFVAVAAPAPVISMRPAPRVSNVPDWMEPVLAACRFLRLLGGSDRLPG